MDRLFQKFIPLSNENGFRVAWAEEYKQYVAICLICYTAIESKNQAILGIKIGDHRHNN